MGSAASAARPDSGARPRAVLTGTGMECIGGVAGWEAPTTFSWASGVQHEVRYRCNYSAVSFPGVGQGYVDGTRTPVTGQNLFWYATAHTTGYTIGWGATSGWRASVWVVNATAQGFIDLSVWITAGASITLDRATWAPCFQYRDDRSTAVPIGSQQLLGCMNTAGGSNPYTPSTDAANKGVAFSAIQGTAMPADRWQAQYVPAGGACDFLTVTGPPGSTPIMPGGSYKLTASWTANSRPTMIAYAYNGVNKNNPGFYPFALGSSIPTNAMPPFDFPVLPAADVLSEDYTVFGGAASSGGSIAQHLSDVIIACEVADPVSMVRHWQQRTYGASGWTASADVPSYRACSTATIQWGPNVNADGSMTVQIFQSLAASRTDAYDVQMQMRYLATAGPTAWSSPQTAHIGIGADGVPLVASLTFMPGTGWGKDFYKFDVECIDAAGEYHQGFLGTPNAAGAQIIPQSSTSQTCFDRIDPPSLIDPSSWVPAMGELFQCLLSYLFVPSPDTLSALYRTANVATTKAPISFFAQTIGVVRPLLHDVPEIIGAHRNECFDVLPGGLIDGVGAQSACPAQLDSAGSSSARTVLVIIFWAFVSWIMLSKVFGGIRGPGGGGSGEPEQLALF